MSPYFNALIKAIQDLLQSYVSSTSLVLDIIITAYKNWQWGASKGSYLVSHLVSAGNSLNFCRLASFNNGLAKNHSWNLFNFAWNFFWCFPYIYKISCIVIGRIHSWWQWKFFMLKHLASAQCWCVRLTLAESILYMRLMYGERQGLLWSPSVAAMPAQPV